MFAATAAADITPAPGHVLQGHGGADPSHAVLYPLEVRSIVFADGSEKAAVATVDVIGITLELTNRIRATVQRQTGIPADSILIAASHTHCAPATLGCLGMTPDPKWMKSVEDALVRTLVDAAGKLEPVNLGLGCGWAAFNINRRPKPGTHDMSVNYAFLCDRRVRFLRVDRRDGSPLAVLFHYSCHPTAKGGREGLISPDYPGVARRIIEQRMKCHALYMPGCFGNIRPNILQPNGAFASATRDQLDDVGMQLARGVCDAADYVRGAPANDVSGRTIEVEVPYGEPMAIEELHRRVNDGTVGWPAEAANKWARKVLQLIDDRAMPKSEASQMQKLNIGPLTIITVPGEAVQEIGHAIERELIGRTGARDVWAMGYSNDMLGYLCTEEQHTAGGYEPNAYPYFERPAPFHNELATFVAGARAMIG